MVRTRFHFRHRHVRSKWASTGMSIWFSFPRKKEKEALCCAKSREMEMNKSTRKTDKSQAKCAHA